MAQGRFSMEYETINERLLRLRKEAVSPIRNKDRASYMPTFERQGSMELDKIFKENKLKLDTLNTTTYTCAAMVSPRKIGIAKRLQNRCPTEESTESSMSILDQSILSSRPINRMPGRICKNVKSPQKDQFLSFLKFSK